MVFDVWDAPTRTHKGERIMIRSNPRCLIKACLQGSCSGSIAARTYLLVEGQSGRSNGESGPEGVRSMTACSHEAAAADVGMSNFEILLVQTQVIPVGNVVGHDYYCDRECFYTKYLYYLLSRAKPPNSSSRSSVSDRGRGRYLVVRARTQKKQNRSNLLTFIKHRPRQRKGRTCLRRGSILASRSFDTGASSGY